MKNNIVYITIALALLVLLALLTDPFMVYMPPTVAMVALLTAAALACVFSGFVMFERARDEREERLRMLAGRLAYLSGIGTLTLALVVQGFTHAVDPWVALALAVMVITKLVAHLLSQRYH